MPALILSFISAFALTYLAIPAIIRVAKERKLYDQPNERSVHQEPTPSLGGIGIFGGTFCAIILWLPEGAFGSFQYVLAAFMIIFLIGIKDDLMPMSPTAKLMAQLLAAVILVYKADVRISSFYGILGIYELPELSAFMLSVLIIVGIINAFNLIDGINGLAGSIGLTASIFWGSWFILAGYTELATLGFGLAGALTAFLKYNLSPARIFMGDTGSLFIGLVCAIFAIKFVEVQPRETPHLAYYFQSAPAIAISVLILPIYDTLRVFVRRILEGRSPFSPDKTHIHHLLLDLGFSHQQATALLVGYTVGFILLSILLNALGNLYLLLLQLLLASATTGILYRLAKVKKQRVLGNS